MMVDLSLHNVVWCRPHNHPFLLLRVIGGEVNFAVAVATEDLQAMAIVPVGQETGRTRLFGLLEAAVAGLGGRLTEVRLHLEPGALLSASLRIEGPRGALTLPASFADGVIVARRRMLPLRISEEEFARVCGVAAAPEEVGEPGPIGMPAAFQQFIASLELDDLEPGSTGEEVGM